MTTLLKGAFRTISVLSIVSFAGLVGCGLLKKKGGDEADAEAEAAVAVAEAVDAAPAPSAAPAAPAADNVADVARFPDEKPLENAAATIQRTTNVREIPGVGKIVATLAKGGTVTEVASRGTAFLVIFQNPKDQKTLMGWVPAESFTAAPTVDAGIRALTCTAPEVPLLSDGPFCGRVCAGDADCPAGQACKGAANKFTAGKTGDAVTVCTVFTPPAAKPIAVLTSDAGRALTPVVPVTPPPPPAVKCAAGEIFNTKDKTCHKSPCRIGGCPAAQPKCLNCAGTLMCVADRTQCP